MENADKYPKVTPEIRDGMPREVAIEMLCNQKAKLTARFRKNCQAARETVWPSSHPIRQMFLDVAEVHESALCPRRERFRVYDTTQTPKSVEDRLNAKLRSASWAKLHQIARRADARGDEVFRAMQRLNKAEGLPEPVKAKYLAALELQEAKFDLIHSLTTQEIYRRSELCKTKSK